MCQVRAPTPNTRDGRPAFVCAELVTEHPTWFRAGMLAATDGYCGRAAGLPVISNSSLGDPGVLLRAGVRQRACTGDIHDQLQRPALDSACHRHRHLAGTVAGRSGAVEAAALQHEDGGGVVGIDVALVLEQRQDRRAAALGCIGGAQRGVEVLTRSFLAAGVFPDRLVLRRRRGFSSASTGCGLAL